MAQAGRTTSGWLLAAGALLAGACGGDPAVEPATQPPGWADELRLAAVEDLNPDPGVLEINLEAQVTELQIVPGKLTPAWTYNGSLPGPLIRGKVGERLIVHFKNSLPEPTTVHWHGLRIPAPMDGVPEHGQPLVPPGGTFDYDFVLPDAGTYWYHPHYASGEQVGNGLYGALIVDDPTEPAGLGDELVLVLSDMGLDEEGGLLPADGGGDFGTLFGREGNLHLVNGKLAPTLHVREGLRQRWRIVNAAKARYEQLQLPGHSFLRLGGDAGASASPQRLDTLLLTPGQRADVIVEPVAAASASSERRVPLRWVPYNRGFGTDFNRPSEDILQLEFAELEAAAAPPLPVLGRDIPQPLTEGATPVSISLTLNPETDGTLAMGINGVPSWRAEHVAAELGERQLWTVTNTFEWDHPFHFHGFFFQVLDVDGVPPPVREWSDTVNVPVDGSLRFLIHFDERPGMWMFHCHILDHADAGMMGMVLLQ